MIPTKGAATLVTVPSVTQDTLVEAHRRLIERGQSFEDTARRLVAAQVKRERKMAKRAARKPPCGECHLKPGEVCDICGARS